MDSKSGNEGDQAEITSPVINFIGTERVEFGSLLWAETGGGAPQLTVYITSEAGYLEQTLFTATTNNVSFINT